MRTEKQRAFLKWAGGKFRLTQEITARLPQGACLVEPFVGAGSVFLNTQFDRYILADINPDLIHLFNFVKQDVARYIRHAKALFDDPAANSASFYYARRQDFNQSENPFQRAVLFLYLNRFGFNGLCRYNKHHQFNVPFGKYVKPYFPEKELYAFAEKAQNATFICADFTAIFQWMAENPDDYVVYCDPPYAPLKQDSNFTHYAGGGFSLAQQQALAIAAQELAEKGVPVLISNHDTAFTREIYQGAELTRFPVQRFIGQNPSSRIKVGELFALYSSKEKK